MFTREKCFNNKTCHYLKKTFLLKHCSYFVTNHSVTLPEGRTKQKQTTKKLLTVPVILL